MIPTVASLANTTLHLAAWLALLVALFGPLERLLPLHRRPLWRRGIARDVGLYFLNGLLPTVVLAGPVSLLAALTARALPGWYLGAVAALPWPARLAAALVVAEIGAYWAHRLSHEIPFLWRFHRVHHGAEDMDFLVNSRAHPLDVIFVRLSGLAAVYAAGLAHMSRPDGVAVALLLFGTVWGFLVHANIRLRFGPLEHLIALPAFHHWHHTSDENIDRNYAALFPWIDRLFGTLYLPRHWPPAYGLHHPTPTPAPRPVRADALA